VQQQQAKSRSENPKGQEKSKEKEGRKKSNTGPSKNQGMEDVPQRKGQEERRDTSLAMVSQPQTFNPQKHA